MSRAGKGSSCTGKRAHPTKAAAKQQARWLWRRFRARVRAYKCEHCLAWHVGHIRPVGKSGRIR